ncbi:MAG: hypothetical protein KIC56_02215 [Clostridium sp.]|nr:hypothetical protein [Clostridium sp.]MEE0127868.1 hypothetical protein [Clostridia bacterium]
MFSNFDIDNLVAIITCFISGFFGYKVSQISLKNPQRTKILEKQLYYVYLPLFKKMEINLYKKISPKIALEYINFFNNIKMKYYELIDGELINVFQIFQNTTNENSVSYAAYESVCRKLEKLFENTRRKLYLPTRSFSYKLNNRQFPKTRQNFIKSFSLSLLKLLIFISIISLVYFVVTVCQSFINWIISIV